MLRILVIVSALWAAGAVAMGAFGAHALRDALPRIHPPESVARMEANWETAARYHLLHAVAALVALSWIGRLEDQRQAETGNMAAVPSGTRFLSVYCFLAGSLIFAGCLYAMVLGGPRILGAVVPIGGVLMIGGWVALAWSALGLRSSE